MHEELDQIREGLAHAASQPQAAEAGSYRDFDAQEIVLSYDDKGEPTYKVKGIPLMKFGVRLWPETLPALGIDPADLKPGPNPYRGRVRALMGEKGPRKVIGLAAAPESTAAMAHP